MGEERVRRVTIPYAPRAAFLAYHRRTERFACIVAHRRAGKTVATLNDMIRRAVLLTRPHGRYAYVAPYLAQAKEVAWDYLRRYAEPLIAAHNASELWIELITGARIRIHGADNPDRLRGGYLDGAVCDEHADWRPSVYPEVIRPMLADRQGWATFIGTPNGRNEFYNTYQRSTREPGWYSLLLRASETGLLSAAELDAARADMTPEQYAQEFECSFDAAILGAYYGGEIAEAERQGRITVVPYDPAVPVHTAWDLGIGDSTAIWMFQVAAGEVRIVDYYESSGQPLAHYAEVLAARGYRYGDDWVPHDARVRELGTGRTRVETMAALGRRPRLVPDHRLTDGINAARLTLPRCWIDAERCRDGIEALRQYRADYDEKLKTFRNLPRHDWASHAADAFRYLSMAWHSVTKAEIAPKRVPLPGQVPLPGPPEPVVGARIRI